MNLDRLAMQLGAMHWVPLFLIGMGLVLLVAGFYPLIKDGGLFKPLPPPRKLITCLTAAALGIGMPALGGWVMVKRPESRPGSFNPFTAFKEAEDENDSEALARLKDATFDWPATAVKKESWFNWPQWRGPTRDGISGDADLRTDWMAGAPPVVWKHSIGGGYSAPVVFEHDLCVMDRRGSQERVVCLDARTGKDRWAYSYPVDYGSLGFGEGPRATPAMVKDAIYTVGATGNFLCLSEGGPDRQPVVRWRHDLLQEFGASMPGWGVACSPLVDGDMVYVEPGGSGGTVAGFNRHTGQLVWKALSGPAGYSSPVLATFVGNRARNEIIRQLICYTNRGVVGLRAADGTVLWQYSWPTSFDANIATPIVAGNYVFISSAYGVGCALLELMPDGSGGIRARPVYVKHRQMRSHHATPVLYQENLYGFDTGGSMATGPNLLQCMDLRTGQVRWSTREIEKGTLIAAAGHLLILSQNGTLCSVEATPDAFRRTGAVAGLLKGNQCWALPALADGRLYLRDHEKLVCLDLRKKAAANPPASAERARR